MKRILKLLCLLVVVNTFAQNTTAPPSGISPTENYVYSRTYLTPVTTSSATAKQVQSVGYFDGLGRAKQSIAIKASPTGKDIATPIEYDGFGRQTKDYLPVPQSGTQSGGIYPNPLSNVPANYTFNTVVEKIYSEKIIENSPLDRIQQQVQVGNGWSGKPVNFSYEANAEGEVKKYTATSNWVNNATSSALSASGDYAAATLYKNTVTDEDGNISIEFKNGEGQTLLVRKNDGVNNVDTYYVYNEYNQLAFVVPPLAAAKTSISQTDLDNLCYQYRYDGRNRLVEKKLPGKGWEYMVYDKQDRLVATQDANLRLDTNNFEAAGWLFTKYDQFGRVVYTGFTADGSDDRNTLQSSIDGNTTNPQNNEARITSLVNYSGLVLYYSDTAFPTTVTVLLSANYYDTYPPGSPAIPASIPTIASTTSDIAQPTLPQTYTDYTVNNITSVRSTKGLPTASYVKNIDENKWTKNYTFYDLKGRPVATTSKNYLGGFTNTESLLDFAGIPQETYTYHKKFNSSDSIKIKERFKYNKYSNALEKHWHQVNSGTEVLLTSNHYNELGQLQYKAVGDSLQKIDYSYNIRGWMTGINLTSSGAFQSRKLFNYKINYNDPLEGLANPDVGFATPIQPKWNGNIAEVSWRTGVSSSARQRYGYVYDGLNRLTAGLYQNFFNPSSRENSEILTYDPNGNIKTLKRSAYAVGGVTDLIDDLDYQDYTGNKVGKIVDNSGDPNGYEGGGNDITYDDNGNMTGMLDKGIHDITYNYLNLPTELVISDGLSNVDLQTLYRADGAKLKKTNITSTAGVIAGPSTTSTTDYLDGFQYLETISSKGGVTPEVGELESAVAMEPEAFTPLETAKIPIWGGSTVDNSVLQFVPTAEGFYDFTENKYIYQYKDHLGNVRVSFAKDSTGVLQTIETNNYYPFGMNFLHDEDPSYFGQGSYKNYKYNGKELQETGMYDYGARMYMPDIGRWGVVDPMAEVSRRWSPYNYAYSNPIRFVDPDGRISKSFVDDLFKNSGDNTTWTNDGNNNFSDGKGNSVTDKEPESATAPNWGSKPGFEVHQMANMMGLLSSGLKGKNYSSAIKYMNKGTVFADSDQFQNGAHSFMHAMRNGNQSVAEAMTLSDGFVRETFAEAKRLLKEGKTEEAYFVFGTGLHTLQDATSPAHGGFQVWTGNESYLEIGKHVVQELTHPGNNSNLQNITNYYVNWFFNSNKPLPNGNLFLNIKTD